MKTKFIVLVAIIVVIFVLPSSITQAEISTRDATLLAAPPFKAGERIKAGGTDLKLKKDDGTDNIYSVPCVVDWNNDGKKDLLVGCFWNGYIFLFLNSGTNSAPVFTTGTKLKADGATLSVNYG